MKVYISCDMEGISGVGKKEQTVKTHKEYEEARFLMVKDINAAVEGALEGGASEVIVFDAHGSSYNIPAEEIHPEAKLIQGGIASKRLCYMEECQLVFLLGYHAMAGTQAAVLDHTYSGIGVDSILVNDIEMGEIAIDALRCGYYGIPVGLVSGDDKACVEAVRFLGDIETAVVKQGIGRNGALFTSPKKAREIIRQAACSAVKKAGSFKPYKIEGAVTAVVNYHLTEHADGVYANGRNVVRVGPKKIIFKLDSVLELFLALP